ncbi:hypothetical protein EIP91_003796 [Steccherinum ochraceum]|uniref:Uncharacterized protein n=1 Tax=Steccherinum ochraceum TaxID=92696 RepID=A0A4R0RBC0_9APHY|nr:hypothetical protein EIP91_003796 [Steccherinum ochraceum]
MPSISSTYETCSVVFPRAPLRDLTPDVDSDPDFDDDMRVSADFSDASHTSDRPVHTLRLSLIGLGLTSLDPSSSISTPFDVSEPRFDYPFPVEPTFNARLHQGAACPAFSGLITAFRPSSPSLNHLQHRDAATNTFTLTPPHARPRDTPVPPSLAKNKRWSTGMFAPDVRNRKPSLRTSHTGHDVTNMEKKLDNAGKAVANMRGFATALTDGSYDSQHKYHVGAVVEYKKGIYVKRWALQVKEAANDPHVHNHRV